jgi:hypothetical protein
MSHDERAIYEKSIAMLKPALERVASDPAFRERLEMNPLQALDEMNVQIDDVMRAELAGKRFSEFWESHRKAAEGPVEVRDLPPQDGVLEDQELDGISGGVTFGSGSLAPFAPPYVPVGPAPTTSTLTPRLPTMPKPGDFEPQ